MKSNPRASSYKIKQRSHKYHLPHHLNNHEFADIHNFWKGYIAWLAKLIDKAISRMHADELNINASLVHHPRFLT